MAWYPYSYKTAFDPTTGEKAPAGSAGQIYAIGDTGFTTPLQPYDLAGLPVELAVQGDLGYIPTFQVEDETSVVWKSGDYIFEFTTTMPLPGPTGAHIVGATEPVDGAVSFQLSNGDTVGPISIPAGPEGPRGPAGYNATGAVEDQQTLADYVAETAGPNPFSTEVEKSIAEDTATVPAQMALLMKHFIGGTKLLPELVTAWGDSLTHSDGGIWEAEAQQLLGVKVTGRGVSGERAGGIASRQGGITRMLTVEGGQIPASGGVTVTADGVFLDPNLHQSEGACDGILAGVHGTITAGAGWEEYVFTRSTDGTTVPVPAPQPWVSDDSLKYRDALNVIWAGRNNFPLDIDGPDGDIAGDAIQAMVDNLAYPDKYLILTVPNGEGEGVGTAAHDAVVSFAAWLEATFPGHVLDVRRKLIDDGLTELGITPTAQDSADIAADTVPDSLRKDWIHLVPAAYELVGRWVADFIAENGWVKTDYTPTPPPEPVVLTSDSFNRADTAAGEMGVTDGAYGGTSGLAWTDEVQMQILSNQVGASTLSTTRFPSVDVGATDVRVKVTVAAELAGGVLARKADTANYYCAFLGASAELNLEKRVGGSTTPLGGTAAGAVSVGDTISLKVSGSTLTAYINDTQVIQATDADLTSGTHAGLRSSFSNTASRLDDFVVTDF